MAGFPFENLSEKQLMSIVQSTSRINIWEGAVRSGKTIASIFRWLEFLRNNPPQGGTFAMIGKTQTSIQRNILDPIMDFFPGVCKFNRGTGEFYFKDMMIEVIGANDERAQDKIRGRTMAGAYGDEVSLWPESFWTMLLSRLSVRGAKFFGTTNPDSPYHYLKKDYIDRTGDLDISVFHFTLPDNPALDPRYVANLKKEYTGLWYKRFIEGLWVQAEGAIYDMFDTSRHVIDVTQALPVNIDGLTNQNPARKWVGMPAQKPIKYFVAIDYGTANATVFGLFAHRGDAPPVYLLKEYYYDGRKTGRQKTDSEYADDLLDFIGPLRGKIAVYIDPSALSFITEVKKRGIYVCEAKNAVIDGIRFVGDMLRNDLFKMDTKCIMTQEELQGYIWDEKAQRKGEDKPVKERDHACDMVRYGLFSHFYKRGNTVVAGFNYK